MTCAEPVLDFHEIEAGAEPVGGRGFPEPVKVMLLAYRASLARYLDFMAVVVPSFAYGNFAPPAVETGSLGDCLELSKKVTFRLTISSREDPAVRFRVLLIVG